LPPGLHLKWPWPLGSVRQYPVKKVTVMPVGFVLKDDGQPRRALLWSKTHAGEEFKLVLGDGSEVVVVDALVYYKICEDERRFRQYVYDNTNPDEALEAYAYRALMEQTRGATLNQILTLNREQFAGQLRTSLARYAEQEGLGIEVVEVALVALHPPEEVVPSFLDVIGAQIDATRMETEADGKRVVKLTESEQQRDTMIAEAEQFASQRVGEAIGQSSEFLALGEGYAVSPEAIRLRFWFETIEQTLSDRPLIILDKSLTTGPGETLFDLRKYQEIIPGGVR